ncbi:MAG TPA: polyprenyl synthetase family protein [Syntrophales bacterium]|nr:polyprenyl synthetase family protein [Syntrophales bacterium]HOL60177.1 polyprenyl synthetase family protein [Syntrophales bacterium]HPO36356.1 polyprenyl synthetase family protein [Syntrophales bacterium]
MNKEAFFSYLEERKSLIEKTLEATIPLASNERRSVYEAMRYSLLAGGKRIRPILCLASAEAVGGEITSVLPVACAIECIHTYSLIHDDLPAMDNDDFRRGRPTCHRAFGEGLAILAGDALLTEAFAMIAQAGLAHPNKAHMFLRVTKAIAQAAGVEGMVGGQVMDIESEGKGLLFSTLEEMHRLKTGAMIRVSVFSGAYLGGGTEGEISALEEYGGHLGLAFQIADDILNVIGDKNLMGKTTGSDASRGKPTFPSLLGLEESKRKLEEEVLKSLEAISGFDEKADPLRHLATYVMEREH